MGDRCDWVYVDDVAETACRFFSGGMNERVFNLSSGRPQEFTDVVAAAGSRPGCKSMTPLT